jgi:hypothetical protein
MTERLHIEKDEHVAIVQMNRPEKHNAPDLKVAHSDRRESVELRTGGRTSQPRYVLVA